MRPSFSKVVFFFLVLIFFAVTGGKAQIIHTIAGSGLAGFGGDGGPASAAAFNSLGIAFDANNNLYVCDRGNNRIRVIENTGIVHTIAGTGGAGFFGDGGPASAALLNIPVGVAVDSTGNIYFVDAANYRIRKINTSGIISTIAGTGVNGYNGDGIAATTAQLGNPGTIAVDRTGNVYLTTESRRIRKIDLSGVITTIAGTAAVGFGGDGGPATDAVLFGPTGLVADGYGDVFIADMQNNRIRKIDAGGMINTIAGNSPAGFSPDGTLASVAHFNYPSQLFLDKHNQIYFTDINNYRIRMIDSTGVLHTVAGNGTMGGMGEGVPATAAQIAAGCPLAFDCAGNLYFDDNGNYRIRKVTYNRRPQFSGGHSQTFSVCDNATHAAINTLLGVVDTDMQQTLTWSVTASPAHGTLVAAYTASTTGSLVTPTGLSYTATTGYSGPDTFKVAVTDCDATDTTVVYVTVHNCSLGLPGAVISESQLMVFPNPTTGNVTCIYTSPTNEPAQIRISSLLGNIFKEATLLPNIPSEIELDAPAGVYILSTTGAVKLNTRIVLLK